MCTKWFREIFPSRVVQQLFAEHSIKYLQLVTQAPIDDIDTIKFMVCKNLLVANIHYLIQAHCFAEYSQTVYLSVKNSWHTSTTVL